LPTEENTAKENKAEEDVGGAAQTGKSSLIHRLRTPVSIIVSLAVIALAVYGLHHALRHVSLNAILAALAGLTKAQIARAAFFACASFAAIIVQEYFALKTAGHPQPLHRAAIGGFMAQSIGHSTGFSVAIGGGLRYRYYSRFGATLADVAKVQASFSGTLALALGFQLATAMLLHPYLLNHAIRLSPWLIRAIGGALLLVAGTVLAMTARKTPLRIFGTELELPPFKLLAPQVICSILDIAFLSAAAQSLLPPGLGGGHYTRVLGIAVVSLTLGIASSVPGGLGIFESSVLLLMAPKDDLVAATFGGLLAFRAIYYWAPLVLGLLLALVVEAVHRREKA
jgi:uncharacterized membrane protein YbhN (UPF0104 family)